MDIAMGNTKQTSLALDNEIVILINQLKRASKRVGGPDIQMREISNRGYVETVINNLSSLIHQEDVGIIEKLRDKLGIADGEAKPSAKAEEKADTSNEITGKYFNGARS